MIIVIIFVTVIVVVVIILFKFTLSLIIIIYFLVSAITILVYISRLLVFDCFLCYLTMLVQMPNLYKVEGRTCEIWGSQSGEDEVTVP